MCLAVTNGAKRIGLVHSIIAAKLPTACSLSSLDTGKNRVNDYGYLDSALWGDWLDMLYHTLSLGQYNVIDDRDLPKRARACEISRSGTLIKT